MKKIIILLTVVLLSISFISLNVCAKSITLKFAHVCPATHPYQIGAEKFKDLIEEKSNGEITVDTYPAAQLGQERDLLEGLQLGTIDIAFSNISVAANFSPSMLLFGLPFLFKDGDHFMEVARGPIGQKVLDGCEGKGFKGLGIFVPVFRYPMTNVRPILKPDDFKGLRIRLMEVPLHMDAYKAMGASVVPLPGGEIYTALQLGTIDGCENDITTLYTYKWYEVAKHLSLLPVVANGAVVLISDKTWNKLTVPQQEMVKECMPEALDSANAAYSELSATGQKLMEEAGKKVYTPDPKPFADMVESVNQKYLDTLPEWVRDAYLEIKGD